MSEIPKEELTLYDRQIRVWGLEAQKKYLLFIIKIEIYGFRLRKGSILVVSTHMNTMAQEICKNLALCGISSLELKLQTSFCSEKIIYVIYYFIIYIVKTLI